MDIKKPEGIEYSILNWGPCVMKMQITDEFHKKLMAEAAASRKPEYLMHDKLAGIIKEEYKFRDKELLTPELARCIGVYDEAVKRWSNKIPDKQPQYNLRALWVNYQGPNEFNPPHDHSDTLSFVIYLDVPEEIHQEQKDYGGKSSGPGGISFLYGEGTRQAITYQAIMPKTKDMWIFPAWCKHFVAPFRSDVTRISVSGNVTDSVPLNAIKANTTIAEENEKYIKELQKKL